MTEDYEANGRHYELIMQARYYDDKTDAVTGELAIFRVAGNSHVFAMPLAAFKKKMDRKLDNTTLYLSRFNVRRDVYAERYDNKKTGKKGYTPKTDYTTRQRLPLTPQVIQQHLDGTIAIGLYPLLADDTTNLLALDIDQHNWADIAQSLRQVCAQYHVPCLVEKSQSGNGCHLWIFFTSPISAQKARLLGRNLLTTAMTTTPEISFAAFDRMFPSQDLAINHGPGNLIAAPLQGKFREEGRTVFLDDDLQPLADQWAALRDVHTLTEAATDAAIGQMSAANGYLTYPETADTQLQKNDLLSLPANLQITEDSVLHIAKAGLTNRQIGALRWLGTFDNPQFYKMQKARLSTYQTPRYISLTEETATELRLPRGLKDYLNGILPHIRWKEKLITGHPLQVTFKGTLRPDQEKAKHAMLQNNTGILSARTGFGKTVVAAAMIAERKVSTIVLVNNKGLADQWRAQLTKFLTIKTKPIIEEKTATGRPRKKDAIGRYYGAVKNRSGIVDIATLQSLARMSPPNLRNFLSAYGQIIMDEVHHIPAFTYEGVLKEAAARYLCGLSATPYREDGLDPIITMRVGAIRYQTDTLDPAYLHTVARTVYPRFTSFGALMPAAQGMGLPEALTAMGQDAQRNELIVADVRRCAGEGRHILVLTQRVNHAEELSRLLQKAVTIPVHTLYGQQDKQNQAAQREAVTDTRKPYCLVATGSYIGEGFDVSSIDTLVLALPVAGKSILTQYLGRMQRSLAKKPELRVYDYVDGFLPVYARMYKKRLRTYHGQGYIIAEDASTNRLQSRFFDGNYWTALSEDVAASTKQVVLTGNRLQPDDVRACLASLPAGRVLTIFGNKLTDLKASFTPNDPILWQDAHRGVPTGIILDQELLWFFADQGFGKNTGIAFRVANPQLTTAVLKLLGNDNISLDL